MLKYADQNLFMKTLINQLDLKKKLCLKLFSMVIFELEGDLQTEEPPKLMLWTFNSLVVPALSYGAGVCGNPYLTRQFST